VEQKMNSKLMIAFGAALVAASTSFAQDAKYPDTPDIPLTLSRAEVLAELHAARASGMLNIGDATYPGPFRVASNKTRQQVVAELKQFRAEHPDFNSELNYAGATPMQSHPAGIDRPSSVQ
jgi:hypothetical protein